jgi:ABC-type dipeptide/oligopeptide/nickel transport system ATPase component
LLPANAQCAGSILFDGKDLLSMHSRELRQLRGARFSLIPQDPASALNPVIRIGAQISEVLRAHWRMNRSQRQKRVRELLSEVGLDDHGRIASSYPHQLSGGQRQRVVFAQAIACRPALIIADESISKLDGPLQLEIISLLTEIVRRHETALIWITHELATAAIFSNRLAVMVAGQIVEEGLTQDLLRRPVHPYTQELVRLSRERMLISRCAAGH